MKRILMILLALVALLLIGSTVKAQSVSVLVNPKPHKVAVDVAVPYTGVHVYRSYIWVQPSPVIVQQPVVVQTQPLIATPVIVPPPPKPIFPTPWRDKMWRKKNPARIYYHVQPLQPQPQPQPTQPAQ